MLKVISIILLAALLAGCTNTEAPQATPVPTQEPGASPTPGASPGPVTPPTATATPEPTATATPAPEPVVTKSDTPLDITREGDAISFTTGYDVCEDWTLEWDCLTEGGTTTCTPSGLGSGAVDTATVTCMDHNNPLVMEEFTGAVQ